MAGWTTSHPSRTRPVADEKSITRHGTGVEIDWANVSSAYLNAATGKKEIPAWTVLGLLLGGGSKASPRADTTNPAVGFLETPAVEDALNVPAPGMYGMVVGGNLYENLLPEASGSPAVLTSDVKDELAAAGSRFYFQQYGDTP
jgi:hypothetical protein